MKNLKVLKGVKIAHRGLWNNEVPENSIGAFKRCIDKGIPIEFDVHILKDNTLVIFHDDNLLRMTGKDIDLKNSNYNDIKNIKLKNSNFYIPTLQEVLDLVDGKVLLDIELKTDVKGVRICSELCKYLDKYDGKFVVKSFNPLYILWFKIKRPNFIRGLLVSKLKKKKMNKLFKMAISKMWFNFLVKPDFIAIDYKCLPNKKIEKLKKRNVLILLFTLDESLVETFNDYDGFLYEEKRT